MKMLDPIYPELIEKIKADYQAKIDAETDETMKKAYQVLCETAVAEEIGKQRQEAIARGGALGARIKAENEAFGRELAARHAAFDPKLIEEARKRQEESDMSMKRPAFCPNCGTRVVSGKFCTNCGMKLV